MPVTFHQDKHIHLHVHSRFSSLDGLCKLEDIAQWAADNDASAIAVTDHGNMVAAVKHYKECKERGIKPIIGQEFYISNPDDSAVENKSKTGNVTNHHLVLLAYTQEGYFNLCRLSSYGWQQGHYYKPRIDFPALVKYNEGLLCLTACIASAVGESLCPRKGTNLELSQPEREKLARSYLDKYHKLFGDRLYLEIMNHELPEEQIINPFLINYSIETGVKIVTTNDVHYVNQDQAVSQNYLMKVSMSAKNSKKTDDDKSSATINAEDDVAMGGSYYYLKTKDEMAAMFVNYPDFVDWSAEVANRVQEISPILPQKMYPAYISDNPKPVFDQLSEITHQKLIDRGLDNEEYRARLEYELDVIKQKSFADVFMLIYDVCQYADQQNIMRACRGSAASSLVLYLLDVTFLDPIKEHLIFERFIDVDRDEIPDIDTDWEPNRRQEIIDYIRTKYGGSSRVVQIQTFGTLGPRQVLNDLAKITERQYGPTDYRVSLVREMASRVTTEAYGHDEEGVVTDITLEHCLRTDHGDPEKGKRSLFELIESDNYAKLMWKCALDMEGAPRQGSTHAGGVVITADDAFNVMPLQMATGMQMVVTQFDMNDLETIGVGKVDILGLNNLGVIANACKYIQNKPGFEAFSIRDIPTDDDDLYDFVSVGNTRGVFQVERDSFTRCVMQVKPRNFQELADLIALFRPGPLGDFDSDEISLKDEYCLRKHGQVAVIPGQGQDNKFMRYIDPTLFKALNDTYGTILYQEQVMRIANELAGMGRTEGYKIVKAISKKKRDQLNKWRDDFVSGAVNNGYNQQWVENLWSSIERFAGYSFNMAHAKSYALITYWTMYLSRYHPVEFFCAYLNSNEASKVTESGHKRDLYIAECYRRGIPVLVPDINESGYEYTITPHGIRYGIQAIKGISKSAEHIINERNINGPFTSYQDFCNRVPPGKVNSRMRDVLVRVGAFDVIEPSLRINTSVGDRINDEMEFLGTIFDLSIIDNMKRQYKAGITTPISNLEDGGTYTIMGLVLSVGTRTAHKSGKKFGVGVIRDEYGLIDVVCFSPLWESISQDFQKGAVFALQGTIDTYQDIKKQMKVINAIKVCDL